VVPSLIEITLVKEVSGRWDALEAPVRKGNLYKNNFEIFFYLTLIILKIFAMTAFVLYLRENICQEVYT
jgi:hypothetical protein